MVAAGRAEGDADASLDLVSKYDYHAKVTASELKRWLKKQGCTFEEGTKHTKVILGAKATRMPRHPSQELKSGTLQAILKDLDLKM